MKRIYIAAVFLFSMQILKSQTVTISANNQESAVKTGDVVKVTSKPPALKVKVKATNAATVYTISAGNEIKATDFPGDDKFHDIPATFTLSDSDATSGDISIKEKSSGKEIAKFKLQLESSFTLSFDNQTILLANEQQVVMEKRPAKIAIAIDDRGATYVVSKEGEIKDIEVQGDNKPVDIAFDAVSFDEDGLALIQFKKKGSNDVVFEFQFSNPTAVKDGNNGGNEKKVITDDLPSFDEFISKLAFDIDPTQFGLVLKGGNSKFLGKKYVHIFLDQYGNSWSGTIPQGIADRQYVVHMVYLTGIQNNIVIFDVKKKKGSFNPALNYLNADLRKTDTVTKTVSLKLKDYTWVHREFLVGTSTTDIEFEVTKTTIAKGNEPYNSKNESVGTYTIQMTPVYHGSFNVGFVNTNLANPTYALFDNPANTDEKVVKKSEDGKRAVITVMATAYTSIPIFFEKLFGADIPWNKTYSRNFLDDHRLLERIYPALGVGFTDKTLENIFYGVDWEVTRGLGLFAGWHRGKINTYNAAPGFKFSETVTSEAEFNLRSDRQWKTEFAFGVNIDPLVVSRLLSSGLK